MQIGVLDEDAKPVKCWSRIQLQPLVRRWSNWQKEHASRKTFATWHNVRYVKNPTPDELCLLSQEEN